MRLPISFLWEFGWPFKFGSRFQPSHFAYHSSLCRHCQYRCCYPWVVRGVVLCGGLLVTKEGDELRRDKFGNTGSDELDSLASSAQFSGVRLDFLLSCSKSLHTCGRVFGDFQWSSVVQTRKS